ncbi:hypothetical protein BKA65DRAFT_559922 [Rhexocercosporidium sp. MPI-PUGE-AT-0058]|nr:hypothetical protein BKA65DRAFT_559922 [Rhexocercosporidium sp. MPI-PUGE-AT-0058]
MRETSISGGAERICRISSPSEGFDSTIEVIADTSNRPLRSILFKKNISPIKKWAYVEGLVTWLYAGEIGPLTMSDNSDGLGEIFNFLVTFMFTGLEVLGEHSLINPSTSVLNATVCTLLMINSLKNVATDSEVERIEQIVRAADESGLVWDFHKETNITKEMIQGLRDGIKPRAEKPDWKKEWPSFKPDHPGGNKFDITKMSKAQKKKYAL